MGKPDPSVAANKRTDDLRKADQRLYDEKMAHMKDIQGFSDKIQQIHIDYAKEFRETIVRTAEMIQSNADIKASNLAELLKQYKDEMNAQITELRLFNSNFQGKLAVIVGVASFLSAVLTWLATNFIFPHK
jgi:hypothetical protein